MTAKKDAKAKKPAPPQEEKETEQPQSPEGAESQPPVKVRQIPPDYKLDRVEPDDLQERFSPRARTILDRCYELTTSLGHGAATTGHLIAVICAERAGISGDIFTDINAFPEMFEEEIGVFEELPRDEQGNWFDTDLMVVFDRARDAMEAFEDEAVEPEHLMLGLLSLPQGIAADVLEEFSIDRVDMREELLAMMGVDPLACPDWERGILRRKKKRKKK